MKFSSFIYPQLTLYKFFNPYVDSKKIPNRPFYKLKVTDKKCFSKLSALHNKIIENTSFSQLNPAINSEYLQCEILAEETDLILSYKKNPNDTFSHHFFSKEIFSIDLGSIEKLNSNFGIDLCQHQQCSQKGFLDINVKQSQSCLDNHLELCVSSLTSVSKKEEYLLDMARYNAAFNGVFFGLYIHCVASSVLGKTSAVSLGLNSRTIQVGLSKVFMVFASRLVMKQFEKIFAAQLLIVSLFVNLLSFTNSSLRNEMFQSSSKVFGIFMLLDGVPIAMLSARYVRCSIDDSKVNKQLSKLFGLDFKKYILGTVKAVSN